VWREQGHGFNRAPPVRNLNHALRVESMQGCPSPPGGLDALRRIYQDSIEVKKKCRALESHAFLIGGDQARNALDRIK
jgi:hypothetical protein